VDQEQLAGEFHQQTAQITWHELQPQFARGAVVIVGPALDLVEVALQLRQDNKAQFEQWLTSGDISGPSDEQAQQLFDDNPTVWAVVAAPWVLVQLERR
jgi:hypothetical protein